MISEYERRCVFRVQMLSTVTTDAIAPKLEAVAIVGQLQLTAATATTVV